MVKSDFPNVLNLKTWRKMREWNLNLATKLKVSSETLTKKSARIKTARHHSDAYWINEQPILGFRSGQFLCVRLSLSLTLSLCEASHLIQSNQRVRLFACLVIEEINWRLSLTLQLLTQLVCQLAKFKLSEPIICDSISYSNDLHRRFNRRRLRKNMSS